MPPWTQPHTQGNEYLDFFWYFALNHLETNKHFVKKVSQNMLVILPIEPTIVQPSTQPPNQGKKNGFYALCSF